MNLQEKKPSPNLTKVLDSQEVVTFTARQRILAAALKLFVEQGYFNTNVPDLSRVSMCSVGSIYHNFKNKEEVASALYDEGIFAFRQALQDSLGTHTAPQDVLKTVVKSFLLFSEANHQLSKYLWLCRHNEFMTGLIKHPTRIGFNKLGRALTKAIKSGVRNGEIQPLKAHVIWSVLFGIPLAYVRDWLDGYNPEPPHKVADQLAELCWKALQKQG